MKLIAAVCRKEMLDNVRDRRTMFSTLAFGPLFAPLMFVVMIQIAVNQAVSSAEERLRVAMVGIEQAPNLEEFLAARGIDEGGGPGGVDLSQGRDGAGQGAQCGAGQQGSAMQRHGAHMVVRSRAPRVQRPPGSVTPCPKPTVPAGATVPPGPARFSISDRRRWR